ncbi:hypothetical protein [Halocynthiibacter sp.]|uniref:hypothetical protein n=1 Tax=Halocynthiibacter sp. TaxID=1979210 RepID=UPI003C5D482B
MLGRIAIFSRIAVLPIALLALIVSAQISSAQQSEFLLEGGGDSGVTDYSLLIAVSGNLAKIAVKGSGCLGEMDASFSRIDRLTWLLSSIGDGDNCEILLKEDGYGLIETIQGPGCSYYHGAVCGFSGRFKAPTSNGLAPIFDSMG